MVNGTPRPLDGKRRGNSLESRIKQRATKNVNNGDPAGWAADALDMVMEGYTFGDIGHIMDKTCSAVRQAVYMEAFFRLCMMHGCTYVDDLTDRELPRFE